MSKLSDVNTTDLRDAIHLGCQTMCSVFNRDDDNIPFFSSQVLPKAFLAFSWAHSESHVPGRHLNALLNAEDAVGITLDEDCVDAHAQAAFFSYGGPVPLPLNRDRAGGELQHFLPHNIREGFHALYALARFRDSTRAKELIEVSVDTILKLWDPVDGWDNAHLEDTLGLKVHPSTFIPGLARAIGPLVKLHRTVGCASALNLALLIKEKAIRDYFTEDGAYDRETFGTHTHSVTCVLSSLAQLAELTSDASLMNHVRAFYCNGLQDISDAIGWSPESSADDAHQDRGEANNTGDIVETALILGRWGYPECYEDAERILRCHLLPSQLRDISFINDSPNPQNVDGKRDVARRHSGAFGFPAPYGHRPVGKESLGFNMDIVGGVVGSLCESYRHVVRSDEAGLWINMLFDHDSPQITVRSPYTHDRLQILVKHRSPLFVRIPSWVDTGTLTVDGKLGTALITGGHLLLTHPPMNQWITIDFPLLTRKIRLAYGTRDLGVVLRGDEVLAMDNLGADLTFFDPIKGS
jgi:hypothetical protein